MAVEHEHHRDKQANLAKTIWPISMTEISTINSDAGELNGLLKRVAKTPTHRTYELDFVDGQPVFRLSAFDIAFEEALDAAYGPGELKLSAADLIRPLPKLTDLSSSDLRYKS